MHKRSAFLGVMAVLLLSVISQAQMQVYGAWHCGNNYCTWASVRNMTDTCEGGVGVGAKTYNIPLPMPALRQN